MIKYIFNPVTYHHFATRFSKYINFVISHKAVVKRKKRGKR